LHGTLNIFKSLKNVTTDEDYLIICPSGYGYEDIEFPVNSKCFFYKGSHSSVKRFVFERFNLPAIIKEYRPDIIYGAGNIGLINPVAAQALMIHNAYLFYGKEYFPDIHMKLQLRIAILKAEIKKMLAKTDLVFCQTPVVKNRFCAEFKYPPYQAKVINWPNPTEIRPRADLTVPAALDKSGKSFYILVLTRYLPHRNPEIILKLCERYSEKIKEKQIKFITTVEAGNNPRAGRFLSNVGKAGFGDIIINVGQLSREDVARYFMHSDILWEPTTLETLCLPFVEAMTMGVPILAPDIDFARYVCGEAAVFYNPWDLENIFEQIMLLRDNNELRQGLIVKGKVRLENKEIFPGNWDETAKAIIKQLKGLL